MVFLSRNPFAAFLPSLNRAFWAGLSASGRTVGALHCDYGATWRVINRPGTFAFTTRVASQDDLCARRCLPNTLFPIGVEPEVSAHTPMSTAGAGSRGIAAAKETCSGTN